jgi:hypothetical protein
MTDETARGGILERYDNWNPDAHELKVICYQCRIVKEPAPAV